jgi:sugar/nucleoside kinase (ribokinase family)
MTETKYDLTGIGNAIVDVVSNTTDEFIARHDLNKGAMQLIDQKIATMLYNAMGPGVESSGGSAANTIAGAASLGIHTCFIGRVADDELGSIFAHDIKSLGADFPNPPTGTDPSTALCLVLVTPDAERTMNTYLGACVDLGPEDIPDDVIAASAITYMEGYLWDPPRAKEAFLKAMKVAHEAGRKVSLTLSDGFCVDRHRAEFLDLVENRVDILFANEDEIMSLYQVDEFDAALQAVRGHCEIAALTRSEKGSVIISGDEVHVIDAEPVARAVDTTGAGDLYAAGFLTGLSQGRDLHDCGRMGSVAAAEVISHLGARPHADLAALVADSLG